MEKNMKNWWCFSEKKPKILDLLGVIYTGSDLEKVEGAIAQCLSMHRQEKIQNWLFIAEIKNLEVFWKGETLPNFF